MRGIVLIAAATLAAPPAFAQASAPAGHHGHGHAEHHDWYRTLISPVTGISYCDNKDCRPTRAYVDDDGAWRALLNGRWVDVPRDKVLRTKAPDGNSHICANEVGVILCFVGGVPKS